MFSQKRNWFLCISWCLIHSHVRLHTARVLKVVFALYKRSTFTVPWFLRSFTPTLKHPVRLFKSSNSSYESVWKGGNVHLDLGNGKPQAVLGSNSDPGGTCLCGILSKWPFYSRVQCPDLRNGSTNNDYPQRVSVKMKTQWDNSCPVKAWHGT